MPDQNRNYLEMTELSDISWEGLDSGYDCNMPRQDEALNSFWNLRRKSLPIPERVCVL